MYEYSHGGNAVFEAGKSNIIDLSANINPLGIPQSITDAILKEVYNINSYPDHFSNELRQHIGLFENISPDWVFCGNGASDIIFRLPRALQAKKVLVTAPTFSDYERSAHSFGSEVIYYSLTAHNHFAVNDKIIEFIQRKSPDIVFICNPNNPTGQLTEVAIIEEVLDYCEKIGAKVVVDECFLDFVKQAKEYTSKIFLDKYSNLIILKAFTKIFAIPGIRLGYALSADDRLLENLYFHGSDWSVSNLAQAAGIAALQNAKAFIEQTEEYVSKERYRMENRLKQMGYKVFEASANYVFFQSPYPFDLQYELDKKGIRIRSCRNVQGLDDSYYRIAVSTKENNTIVLAAIAEIVDSHSKANGTCK